VGLFIDKLKQILRRKKKDPAYSLSAEWVLRKLKRPIGIELLYDKEKLSIEQIDAVGKFRVWRPMAREVFIQCTKLAGKIEQEVLIERAIELCCADACFRVTGIRVKVMAHVY